MRIPLILNNHRNDPILAWKHFKNSNHNFQRDAEFTLTERITKTFTTTGQLRQLPFWILKLKTLYLDGLNQELKTKFWSFFTVIFRSRFGIHTSRNITTTTIELLENIIYMTSNFPIVNNSQILRVCSSDKMTPIYFLYLFKVWSMLHHGSVWRVHKRNITWCYYVPFCHFFVVFHHKLCVSIIFIPFFDKVSNLGNRILRDLVVSNCQRN